MRTAATWSGEKEINPRFIKMNELPQMIESKKR